MKFTYAPGATPIRDDELRGLLPNHIDTQSELNQWEEINIAQAQQWAFSKNSFDLSEPFIRQLHLKMFDETWAWAGKYRTRNKNIGIDFPYITLELSHLVDDVKHQVACNTYNFDEIATRLHHRLVAIHPFPNGNGRHARLYTDLFLLHNGKKRFSWGSSCLTDPGLARDKYIQALRKADRHELSDLLAFVRS